LKRAFPNGEFYKTRSETFFCVDGVDPNTLEAAVKSIVGNIRSEPPKAFVDWRAIYASLQPRFASLPTLQEPLRQLFINLDAGNNVVLLGPPGSGKTFIMESIAEELDRLGFKYLFVNATSMTKAALENEILKAQGAVLVMIDELDKALSREAQVLLQLLDEYGVVRILKSNGGEARLSARVVASMNTAALRRKAQNVWQPLLDRAVIIEVPRPSPDELLALFIEESNTVDEELTSIVLAYAGKTSIRRVLQAARYVKKAREWGINREEIKRQLLKILGE
jgi:MoxR-like ATPase